MCAITSARRRPCRSPPHLRFWQSQPACSQLSRVGVKSYAKLAFTAVSVAASCETDSELPTALIGATMKKLTLIASALAFLDASTSQARHVDIVPYHEVNPQGERTLNVGSYDLTGPSD